MPDTTRHVRSAIVVPSAIILPWLMAAAAGSHAAEFGTSPRIVAAENFYGDVATQLSGPHARVSSILSNPDQDPHLFEASPSIARDLSEARIVVCNGADYDPWMTKLLAAARSDHRLLVVASELVGRKAGDNPHLWYDPATMPAVARAITADLKQVDPAHASDYDLRLAAFLASLRPIQVRIDDLRRKHAGVPVTATEPVFGYMATAIGLEMRNQRFQLAVMNNTEPAASDVAAMEDDLRGHKVRLFIYNSQATDSAAERLLKIAKESGVPVLGVTETEPRGVANFQGWILGQLDALDTALSHPPA